MHGQPSSQTAGVLYDQPGHGRDCHSLMNDDLQLQLEGKNEYVMCNNFSYKRRLPIC